MARYGYYTTSPPLFGYTGDDTYNLRATVFGSMPENGHAYSMGIRAGYFDASDPCTARLGIYNTSSGNPSTLRAGTGSISVNSRMTSSDTSTLYESNLTAAVLLNSGTRYGLALLSDAGRMAHGQNNTADEMYMRSYSPSTLPSPMSYSQANIETQITIWINYEANVAPNTPTNLVPADGASTTSTTPTYAADFADDNETLPNGLTSDYLAAYQIQVRSVSAENATSGTVVWDSGTVGSSGAEQSSGVMSKVHTGAALSLGTRYQWRCRHQDRLGAWSSWSHADAVAWNDLLCAGGGVVTLDGSPTGRVTDTTPDFQGRWFHQTAGAADRVQVRLYVGSTLTATSPEITKAVASSASPGTLFTITAAESTFGTLADGVAYGYSIRGRATTGSIWSDWSPIRTFNTNARPSTPTNLTTQGSPVTSYPLLTATVSDADGDTLTVSAFIRKASGVAIATRAMTKVGATNVYQYQTVVGDHPDSYATYKFAVSATDGTLTSAESAEQSWVYAQGPVVTITSPTEGGTITTDTPTITWTVTGQVKKQITVYRVSDDALIHDSGLLVNATANYAFPANLLENGEAYRLTVAITNAAPLVGYGNINSFTLTYATPASVTGFLASPDTAMFDQESSVVRLTWVPVTTDLADFEGYILYRRYPDTEILTAQVIAELSTRDQDTWVDTMPESGIAYIYSIVQRKAESTLDILTSDFVDSTAQVNLKGSVISDARDGLQLRVVMDSVQDREEGLEQEVTQLATWDGGPPWQYEGPMRYRTLQMSALLYQTPQAQVPDLLEAFRGAAYEPQPLTPPYGGLTGVRADGSSVIVCYRDERGRKMFGRIRDPQIVDIRLIRAEISFELAEVYYSEEFL